MKNFFQYLIALIIIAIGAILIIENLGIATFNMKSVWLYLYPILFVLFGIKWMIDRIRSKGGSWIVGSFFFIFGSLLLLDRFDVLVFGFKDIYKLWPLFIVYIGFTIIGHSRKKNKFYVTYKESKKDKNYGAKNNRNYSNTGKQANFNSKETKDDTKGESEQKRKYKNDYNKSSMFSIGNHEFNSVNWKVEPMYLSNLVGDFYFDFTKAFIPEEQIPITISALAGDIHILIPENIEFHAEASVIAGDIKIDSQSLDGISRSLSYETSNFHSAEKRLDFKLSLTAGSIRVDRV